MKNWKSLALCLAALICLVLFAAPKAEAATSGYYTYEVTNGKATITDVDSSISGNITIPSTLGGYPVTSIGGYAFSNCKSLTSITIPDGVTSIGGHAFYYCTILTSITIPDSVTSIGSSAFEECTSLTSITIGDSVTSIGVHAFSNCKSLKSITLPDSVTSIGNHAFYYCTRLTRITIPDGVTSIGNSAFYNCTRLTSVTIPDSVTRIGSYAFRYCTSLADVYYNGAKSQWNGISIDSSNISLTNATIHYNCRMHVFTNYVSNNDATCTADGTKTAKCDNCDATDTVADEGTARGHSFTNYTSNNDATCMADGTKTAKCDRCDATDTVADVGTALGHQWDEGVCYPPTLKNEGYTLYTCERCGETRKVVDELPPEILSQPESVTAESGETVQFHVETQGEVVSYKWEYRKIYKWFDTSMDGYNTDTLTVPATGARNGYDYRCIITFMDGTVLTTELAELTVNTYITDVKNPADQTVVLGYKGQFTAGATGEGLKYQWEYRRPDGDRWIETAMEGATKMTVYIESTTARDGYQYRCRITDVTGKVVYTEPATMRVLSFTSHPVETFAVNGSNVNFTVATNVPDGFTYQWQYRRNEAASWTNTTMTGYNTATLTVAATNVRNGYQYRCILTGSKNSKIESKAAVLHVGDPLVLEDQSMSITVTAGKNVAFQVVASNVYTYQWEYAWAGSDTWYATTMEGATTENLKVQATAARNGYRYRCVIKGLDGTEIISQPVTLTVK